MKIIYENIKKKVHHSLFRDVELGKHVWCCCETVSLFLCVYVCTQNLIMSKKGERTKGWWCWWLVVDSRWDVVFIVYKVLKIYMYVCVCVCVLCIKLLVGLIGRILGQWIEKWRKLYVALINTIDTQCLSLSLFCLHSHFQLITQSATTFHWINKYI